jgi:hypothetical protein
MQEILANVYIQYGALGFIIVVFSMTIRLLFADQKRLEKEFRTYLIKNSEEHHKLILQNTTVMKEILEFLKWYHRTPRNASPNNKL